VGEENNMRKGIILVIICLFIGASFNIISNTTTIVIADTNNGLVGYWNFDEGSGSIAHDSSGNGNDGNIYSASWTTGVSGSALNYDGLDDYVDIGSVDRIRTNTPKSVFAWVNLPDGISDEGWSFMRSVVDDSEYSHWKSLYVRIEGESYMPSYRMQHRTLPSDQQQISLIGPNQINRLNYTLMVF
jgi:hypothetical protein